jgi:hypothetical protein
MMTFAEVLDFAVKLDCLSEYLKLSYCHTFHSKPHYYYTIKTLRLARYHIIFLQAASILKLLTLPPTLKIAHGSSKIELS